MQAGAAVEAAQRRGRRRAEVIRNAAIVLCLLTAGAQSYVSSRNVVKSQRQGCERLKIDRIDNMKGWQIAAEEAADANRRRYDARYTIVADQLGRRAHIDCKKAFPNPGILGLHLGRG